MEGCEKKKLPKLHEHLPKFLKSSSFSLHSLIHHSLSLSLSARSWLIVKSEEKAFGLMKRCVSHHVGPTWNLTNISIFLWFVSKSSSFSLLSLAWPKCGLVLAIELCCQVSQAYGVSASFYPMDNSKFSFELVPLIIQWTISNEQ